MIREVRPTSSIQVLQEEKDIRGGKMKNETKTELNVKMRRIKEKLKRKQQSRETDSNGFCAHGVQYERPENIAGGPIRTEHLKRSAMKKTWCPKERCKREKPSGGSDVVREEKGESLTQRKGG